MAPWEFCPNIAYNAGVTTHLHLNVPVQDDAGWLSQTLREFLSTLQEFPQVS